jgi:hypothetical protein
MKINEGTFFEGNQGIDFNDLPIVIQKQYKFLPGTDELVNVDGHTEIIDYPRFVGFLLFIAKFIGVDLPLKGEKVRTTLSRWSTSEDKKNTFWERAFFYENGKKVILKSKFEPTSKGAKEVFKYGLTFEMSIRQIEDGIEFIGDDLSISLFGVKIPIPIWAGLGKLRVTQIGVDENTYDLVFEFIHPVFNNTYYFKGRYSLVEG